MSYNNTNDQLNCQKCLNESAALKSKLKSEIIRQVIDFQFDICIQGPREADESNAMLRERCHLEMSHLRDELDFLYREDVEQFCKHFGACFSARVQLEKLVGFTGQSTERNGSTITIINVINSCMNVYTCS